LPPDEKNQIDLKWRFIKDYIGKGGKKKNTNGRGRGRDRPYSKLVIAKMLEAADLRGKIAVALIFNLIQILRRQKVLAEPKLNLRQN
jgi:hypothetical protein